MSKRPPRTQPWDGSKVTFAFHEDGTVGIRRAGECDPAEACFDPKQQSELADMFAEMHKLNRAVRSANLWLRSGEKAENGQFASIQAELTTEYLHKASGEMREAAFAYVPEQFEGFAPQAFTMKARWDGWKMIPILHVYATAESGGATQKVAFSRTVNREANNGKAAAQPAYRRAAKPPVAAE